MSYLEELFVPAETVVGLKSVHHDTLPKDRELGVFQVLYSILHLWQHQVRKHQLLDVGILAQLLKVFEKLLVEVFSGACVLLHGVADALPVDR